MGLDGKGRQQMGAAPAAHWLAACIYIWQAGSAGWVKSKLEPQQGGRYPFSQPGWARWLVLLPTGTLGGRAVLFESFL